MQINCIFGQLGSQNVKKGSMMNVCRLISDFFSQRCDKDGNPEYVQLKVMPEAIAFLMQVMQCN